MRDTRLELPLAEDPGSVLFAERLRDGRIAIGTRQRDASGSWGAGELHLLAPSDYLALAGWFAEPVREAWLGVIREKQADQLRTAAELYGEGPAAVNRLALDVLAELPPPLLLRALLLLINSLGPEARERLVSRLNESPSSADDDQLRRELAEQGEGLAYAVAAAALYDALDRGLDSESAQAAAED